MMSADPLDVLERIHRDVKLLGELAGPALKVTIEPVKPERTPRSRASANDFTERVAAYLAEHGRSRQAQIAEDLGTKRERTTDALKRLAAETPPRAHQSGAERAPGQTLGRLSPCWAPGPPPESSPPPSHAQTGGAEAEQPAEADEEPATGTETPGAEAPTGDAADAGEDAAIDEGHRADKSARRNQGKGTAALAAVPEPARRKRPWKEGHFPTAAQLAAFEQAQERERERKSLAPPPPSRVLNVLRVRSATSRELAAELGLDQLSVEQELHALKPWLVRLHDGHYRAIERLRENRAAAA